MSYSPFFDTEVLARIEQTCRARLDQDPGDTTVRMHLAWFFVVQAWQKTGEETALSRLCDQLDGPDTLPDKLAASPLPLQVVLAAEIAHSRQNAQRLLQNGLREAGIVMQLTQSPQERHEAEKLQSLVQLFGGKREVAAQKTETEAALKQLSQAVFYPPQELDETANTLLTRLT